MSFFSSLFCFIIITQVLEYKVYSSLVDIKFILYLLINLKILCNFSLSLSFLKSSVLYQMLKDVIGCTKQMGVFFFFSLPVSDGLVGMKRCESQKYKFAARVWDSLLPDLGTVSCIRMFLVANTTQKVNSNWLNNIGARRAYIIENFRKKGSLEVCFHEASSILSVQLFCPYWFHLQAVFPHGNHMKEAAQGATSALDATQRRRGSASQSSLQKSQNFMIALS